MSLAPALLLLAAAVPAGTIAVDVAGVRSAEGRVHVDICPEARFLKDCPYSGDAPARIGTTTVLVHGVPPGRYAAQGFHDANANGKVDRGLFGIPKEGVGFSNDAKIRLGPPTFAAAAFAHGAAEQRIAFHLQYFMR